MIVQGEIRLNEEIAIFGAPLLELAMLRINPFKRTSHLPVGIRMFSRRYPIRSTLDGLEVNQWAKSWADECVPVSETEIPETQKVRAIDELGRSLRLEIIRASKPGESSSQRHPPFLSVKELKTEVCMVIFSME